MMATMLRTGLAVIVGFLLAFALVWLAQYAGSLVAPDVYDVTSGEVLIPLPATLALLVGWFVGTFAGAWLAVRLSDTPLSAWIVAGAIVGASLYRAVTLADAAWMMALGLLVPLLAAWLAQRAAALYPPLSD